MARILSRPMFRKGGLSKAPRPSYRGGGVTAIRPRYKQGGRMTGIMSGIVPRTNAYAGYYNPETFKVPTQNLTEQKPWWGQRLYDWLNPTPEEVMERYNRRLEGVEPIIKTRKYRQEQDKIKEEKYPEIKDTVSGPFDYLQPKTPKISKKGDKTIDMSTPVVSDEEAMESYMKMFEKAAGTEPDEIKKSKWLELAKVGLGVAGAPGGDLLGTIAREGQKGIEGLSKIEGEESAGKRQLRIAGLSAYLKGKDPGSIGKAVRDIMAANPNLNKQEALALALRSGTATRESTAESKTQDIATSLYDDGFVESKTKARGAAIALQESVEQGVPATRYTKLPEKDKREDGAYYIDPKTGVLGRYNKSTGELIEPGEPGFKPEKKK